jgi:flavin reductase (DIM6/NTAB) family NADH-FMN oxidoreductase RutF
MVTPFFKKHKGYLNMRKNLGPKSAVYPMPVFIIGTYDKDGNADAMNAAWGGISEENEISICVSDDHKTTENFLYTGFFTVSIADSKNVVSADYVGIVSGKNEKHKIQKASWTPVKADNVNAPIFLELPLALECKVKSYDKDTCRLVGEIVNISADESILNSKGNVDLTLFKPITYDSFNHNYLTLGQVVGKAFSDGLKLK